VTERKCLFFHGAAGTPAYSATDLRTFLAAVLGGRNFEALAPGTTMIGRGHGVLVPSALAVTAQGSPNNTVNVAAGLAAVRGTQVSFQGTYVCPLDTVEVVTITAKHPSLARTDYVVAQVKDAEYNTFPGDVWEVKTVDGTPGLGAPAVPADCLVLARVAVAPGTGSTVITSADLTDLRPHCRPPGGITPVVDPAELANPQEYDVIWDRTASKLLLRKAGAWVTLGSDFSGEWTSFTPTFLSVTIGSGTRFGRYYRLGRTVVGVAGFDLASNSEVTGGIILTLPVPCYNPGATFVYIGAGRAFIGTSFYSCTAEIRPSFSPSLMFNFATAALPPWGATSPANWADVGGEHGHFRVFFAYEAAS